MLTYKQHKVQSQSQFGALLCGRLKWAKKKNPIFYYYYFIAIIFH